ncbi:MAG: hypothetical protein IPL35_01980 [Sphingobacteriales bacterium]|nr:hypothetical protein [Sphingobacteriales bacterium]
MNELSPKQMLKNTRTIFFVLIAGQLLFLTVVLFINFFIYKTKLQFNLDFTDPLILMAIILSCISIPAGYLHTKSLFKKIDKNELLEDKLIKYQSGLIIRFASCEGIGLLCISFLLRDSNAFFLIILVIALLVMIQYFPTPEKIGNEINLTPSEIDKFSE